MPKFMPDFTIPLPTPLNSIMIQGIRPPIIINNIPFDQYTANLFSSSSFEFYPTPPLMIADKGKNIANEDDPIKAHPLPITKISYKINNSTKEASMRITRDNQPLNLTVYDRFVLKMLGFSEWLEVHALASKARKLDIPTPPELTAFGLSASEKKRKRTSEIKREVFVKDNIVVDGMYRNLIPPLVVVPSEGLVIKEPKLGIFFYNGNFDLVFQREEEIQLTTTPHLIRNQNSIKEDLEIADVMYRKIIYVIEARDDCVEARKIV
ncbi:hypothetical protein Tco_1408524 [Tanacetum coccineum]